MKNSLRINFKKPDDFSCKRILELRGIDSRALSLVPSVFDQLSRLFRIV